VKIPKAIASEARAADIYFTPNSQVVVTSDLGLLGQCATGSVVFEPFRNPVGILEIRSCMSKLYDLHGDLIRQAEKRGETITDAQLPMLWILTPTLSAEKLAGLGAINKLEGWESGVYLLAPLLKVGIIVIHQLPKTPATLWLRLMGRGRVQTEAIREVGELPADSPYREDALKLLGSLRLNLSAKGVLELEEEELFMRLSPLFLEQIEASENRGRQIGLAEGEQRGEQNIVLRLLARRLRVEQLPPQLQGQIQSLPPVKIEELADALLDFQGMPDLLGWLASNQQGDG